MEIGIGRIGSCSKEHQKIYQEWFNFADSDNDGRITGNDAIKFFGMSNLPRPDLKQVWATADSKRLGFLGFKEFVFAMQLVSLAQEGHQISHDFLNVDFENIRPPVMEGLDTLIMNFLSFCLIYSEKETIFKVNSSNQTSPASQWFSSKSSKKISLSSVTSIIGGLKRLYLQKLKPLEVTYHFNDFVSPLLLVFHAPQFLLKNEN
ncbi:hypothetical protein ES332_D04G051000v1 [Gossypium tomentosum]|uniref:EH domain-containing protein n=1 Tax=Gossypium tomentosum TaxID=34277 RepID=A0A5D2LA75_GOSTO|nr:hypothetical protein ES332_D04G051000v1 [Gossypium tomentosum]